MHSFKNRDHPVKNAIVIGAGVIGQACAYRMQRHGIATTLIDDAPQLRPASWGNAGHIAVEQVVPWALRAMMRSAPARLFARGGALDLPLRHWPAWLPFGLAMWRAASPASLVQGTAALTGLAAQALPAWRDLLGDIGAGDLLREDGHFIAWESARSAARGREIWANTNIGTAQWRDASVAELVELARFTCAPIAGAIRFSGSGQIADLGELATALARGFIAAGGRLHTARAQLAAENGRAHVFADGERFDADYILLAAGIASAAQLEPLGLRVPMIAERGYHIEADFAGDADAAGSYLPPVVFEDRSMIVTRFGNRLRAASFLEFSRADAAPDARKWVRLEAHVRQLRLPFTGEFKPWHGSRPTLPDYLPAIGFADGFDNLGYAFGHNHLGLTLAAETAKLLQKALMQDFPLPAAFSLKRFA